jgi:hypothetical protein
MSEIQVVLMKAGDIQSTSKLEPRNQLRGNFKWLAQHGDINIFFTLTPEKIPKFQLLDVSLRAERQVR